MALPSAAAVSCAGAPRLPRAGPFPQPLGLARGQPPAGVGRHQQGRALPRGRPPPAGVVEAVVHPRQRPPPREALDRLQLPVRAACCRARGRSSDAAARRAAPAAAAGVRRPAPPSRWPTRARTASASSSRCAAAVAERKWTVPSTACRLPRGAASPSSSLSGTPNSEITPSMSTIRYGGGRSADSRSGALEPAKVPVPWAFSPGLASTEVGSDSLPREVDPLRPSPGSKAVGVPGRWVNQASPPAHPRPPQ